MVSDFLTNLLHSIYVRNVNSRVIVRNIFEIRRHCEIATVTRELHLDKEACSLATYHQRRHYR